MQEIVDQFVSQYKLAYDYYSNLSELSRDECDRELQSAGIKAITSWRAKNPDSLRIKLLKRDKEKKYSDIEQIQNDIADLAGVRIALYFPSERDAVDKIINDTFIVSTKKTFPEQSQKPSYNKRFSGYWATHYRVMLKPSKEKVRYCEKTIEIQVASVLMHSWSEIEHDLIYKPQNGSLSDEELQILDEINGMVLVGEIALERLRNSMIERIDRKKKFDDSYELKNYLSKYINNINSKNIGNIKYLNEIMNNIQYTNKSKIKNIISELEYYPEISIADELIDKVISDSIKNDKDIERVLGNTKKYKNNISGFEAFLKLWILMESINKYILAQNEISDKQYSLRFEIYLKTEILSFEEVEELKEFRNIRNKVIHGIGMFEDDYLLANFDSLKRIVYKIITSIKDDNVKDTYIDEYKNIVEKLT